MEILKSLEPVPFYYIRHGESEGNVLKLCQGQLNYPLTAVGKAQARLAADRLRGCKIQSLYFSPLKRAAETALIIAELLQIETLIPMEELKERSWGVLEGKSNQPMFAQEETERGVNYDDSNDTTFESKSKFCLRIYSAMDQILKDSESPVAIVGHGRFFNMLCDLMQTEPIRQIANASPVLCWPAISGVWTIDEV